MMSEDDGREGERNVFGVGDVCGWKTFETQIGVSISCEDSDMEEEINGE